MEIIMYHSTITAEEVWHEPAEDLERAFNPFREPASDAAADHVHATISEIERYEADRGLRKRRRRRGDQQTFEATTQSIVCDVIVNALREGGTGVFVSRSHQDLARKTRYDHPANTRQFPSILDALSSDPVSMLRQSVGGEVDGGTRRRTVIWASPEMLGLAAHFQLEPADFRVVPGGETIVLKRPRSGYWDEGGYEEYVDTQQTITLRDELGKANAWLARANLTVAQEEKLGIDLTDRQLRRIFTRGRFNNGGRLFGGFWQPMPKQERLRSLLIDGEAVLEVDYGQIMPRLIYSMCQIRPPMDDLYAIPGFEQFRDGVKKVMSSMMFIRGQITKMPKGTRQFFPETIKIGDVVRAIEAAHPHLQAAFCTGAGHYCQFLESQILMSVLERLRGHGITALPIHDAVLVPASAADVTQQVMLDVFHQHTGAAGVVEVVGR